MTTVIFQEKQALQAGIAEARKAIAALEEERYAIDEKLAGMAGQRQQYQLLEQVCESLDQLERMGAASLFWGEKQPAKEMVDHVARARATAASFEQKVAAVELERRALQARIREEEWKIIEWTDEIAELQEREEAAKNEFVVYREVTHTPYRPMVMPWHGQGEDERRFRKVLLVTMLLTLLFAVVTYIVKFPPRTNEVVEIPERLVQLVKKEPPKPPEKPQERQEETPKDKATPEEKQKARAKAEKSGVLAFKDSFADLMQDSASLKLGADASLSTSGQKAVGQTQRNLVTAQAQAGSGGINTARLSRDVGGTGSKISGVAFTRVESGVAGMQGADRPLSDGPGPSRTDEEIQIVFDRYKAALYRIYQRELRNDPTLRGKMVLKISIEPNGSVSACTIQSSDLASVALKNEVVDRVKKFNFGAKEGVPRITILYPIDFLPAS